MPIIGRYRLSADNRCTSSCSHAFGVIAQLRSKWSEMYIIWHSSAVYSDSVLTCQAWTQRAMNSGFATLGFGRSCRKCGTSGLRSTGLWECMAACCTQALCGIWRRVVNPGRSVCTTIKVRF